MTVGENSTFVIAPTCQFRLGWGGAENEYTIQQSGRFEAFGTMLVGNFRVLNEQGGTVVIDPLSFTLTNEGHKDRESWFDNSGISGHRVMISPFRN